MEGGKTPEVVPKVIKVDGKSYQEVLVQMSLAEKFNNWLDNDSGLGRKLNGRFNENLKWWGGLGGLVYGATSASISFDNDPVMMALGAGAGALVGGAMTEFLHRKNQMGTRWAPVVAN
ncbi:hypothetical protein KBD45_01755 [Candidatus Dojkabacteria bacterium]|nr:hypothetical protein [Candidatus Dojkabacteria bacterium]